MTERLTLDEQVDEFSLVQELDGTRSHHVEERCRLAALAQDVGVRLEELDPYRIGHTFELVFRQFVERGVPPQELVDGDHRRSIASAPPTPSGNSAPPGYDTCRSSAAFAYSDASSRPHRRARSASPSKRGPGVPATKKLCEGEMTRKPSR